MWNWCSHSPIQRFYYNLVKWQNRISPSVINEVKQVADEVSSYISWGDRVEKIVWWIIAIDDLDYEAINWVFWDLLNSNDFPLKRSNSMRKYLNKRHSIKEKDKIPEDWGSFLCTVMTDIFMTVALYINCSDQYENPKILKQRLKWLLFINMNKSDWRLNTSLSWSIHENLKYGAWNIDVNEYIDRMKWFMKRNLKVHEYDEPSCPFAMSEEYMKWVDEMWDFFEKQIFPELKKVFIEKNRSGYMEDFFSWNAQWTI